MRGSLRFLVLSYLALAASAHAALGDPKADINEWARTWAGVTSAFTTWNVPIPMSQLDGSTQNMEFTERTSFRWPDCVKREFAPVDTTAPGAGMLREVAFITPDAELFVLEGGIRFVKLSTPTTLAESIRRYGMQHPAMLARWYQDIGANAADRKYSVTPAGVARVDVPSATMAIEVARENGVCVLRAMDGLDDKGAAFIRYEFSSYDSTGDGPPMPNERTLLIPKGKPPVLTPNPVHRLASHRASAPLPDSEFRVDLSNATTHDPRTGEIKDAGGNVVGTVPVNTWRGPWARWGVVAAAVAVVLVVLIAGRKHLRTRRGA